MIFYARIFAAVLVSLIAACTPRGEITLAPQAADVGRLHSIFVSTTRALDAAGRFDSRRSPDPVYGRFTISVPPDHKPGRIEWPHGKPDPAHDFLTVDRSLFASEKGFTRALAGAIRSEPADNREVIIFVHGYNNTFAEGLYRMAQLADDFDLPGIAVHYSWPSAGSPVGYGYDRDSMLFARDGLEDLLTAVEKAGAKRILLVGHSLGALLVMETLRQTALEGRQDIRRHLRGVVLISPDIDIDIFKQQARRIGKLPQPFLIFSSRRDRALRLSAALTGQKERLGSVSDVSALAELRVTLFDVSEFSEGLSGHFIPATSPALIKILANVRRLDSALQTGRPARPGLVPGTILTVQNATQIILSPVIGMAP